MKKPLKILVGTVGTVVVLAVLLFVGLRLFLPAEKLRDLAVARASAALGREVTVGEVRVSLRGGLGVRLTDVGVGNPAGFPEGRLLAAESVDLKLRLRPLFKRRLHADRLVVEAPRISLVSLDSVRNNFTFAPADSAAPAAAGASPAGAGATLDLERFEVEHGTLEYRDEASGAGFALIGLSLGWTVTDAGSGRLDSRGVTFADSLAVTGERPLAIGPLKFDHAARIDTGTGRLTLETGGLDLTGLAFAVSAGVAFAPAAPAARVEISGRDLDLSAVLALAPADESAKLVGVEAGGRLVLRTTLDFDRARDEPLDVAGSLELADGRLVLPGLPEPVTDLIATVAFNLDTLRVDACRARISGAELAFTGAVTGLRTPAEARIAGTVTAAADLAGLQGYLPAEREAVLTGRAAGSIRLAGRLDSPRDLPAGGEITVTDLGYRDAHIFEPVTDLDADVTFGPRDVTIRRCSVKLQPSRFTLGGVIRGLVPALTSEAAARPHLDFTLDAPYFDADHLFPAASPGAAPLGETAEADRPPVMAEFPDFTGAGRISVANLIYGGVNFTGLTGKVTIADRTVTVGEAAGAVFAGRVTGETTVDLNDMKAPGYRGRFAAGGVQADSVLTRFTPLKGHVFGALDFSGAYTASGKDPAAFRRSLTLDARSAITQARLVTSGVFQRGMSVLAAKLGRSFQAEQGLVDVSGTVKVAGERVIFDRFTSGIKDLGDLNFGGSYGFAGDLDFQGDLLLTEENSRKLLEAPGGRLTGVLDGLLGRGQRPVPRLGLPVKIGGAFTRPDVALDFSALGRTAGQQIADDLKGKLEGMFRP